MTNEPLPDLPDVDELPHPDEMPHDDETALIADANDELMATESQVTEEDLSTGDLMHNGALPDDLERGRLGRDEYQAELIDPAHQDTIEERIRQEVPEEGSAIIPEQLHTLTEDDSQ